MTGNSAHPSDVDQSQGMSSSYQPLAEAEGAEGAAGAAAQDPAEALAGASQAPAVDSAAGLSQPFASACSPKLLLLSNPPSPASGAG